MLSDIIAAHPALVVVLTLLAFAAVKRTLLIALAAVLLAGVFLPDTLTAFLSIL